MKYKWCKKLKHKWVYSKNGTQNLRACSRCGCIEEYRKNIPGYNSGWFLLVMRTKIGAENYLKQHGGERKELK